MLNEQAPSIESGRGHRYNLVTPMARANPCTIIPKTTPSADEGYTMGGLGLGVMEVRKAWLCGWYETQGVKRGMNNNCSLAGYNYAWGKEPCIILRLSCLLHVFINTD